MNAMRLYFNLCKLHLLERIYNSLFSRKIPTYNTMSLKVELVNKKYLEKKLRIKLKNTKIYTIRSFLLAP